MASIPSVAAAMTVLVFAVAATAKTRRPATAEFRGLRLPWPRALAVAVPAAEWAVVGLLVARPSLGAMAAVIMLGGFTGVLARAVAAGDDVGCSCFGSLSSRPVSWSTVGRNAVLLVIASLAATGQGWVRPDLASVLAVVGVVVIGAVLVEAIALRATLGRLWSVELAGEPQRATGALSPVPAVDLALQPALPSTPNPRGSQP